MSTEPKRLGRLIETATQRQRRRAREAREHLDLLSGQQPKRLGRPPGSKNKKPKKLDPAPSISFRVSREHKERFFAIVPKPWRRPSFEAWVDNGCPV